ncbi:diacylglycerol kinase [Enterococcus florum]|uniref:Diacylglycerol kinase n=1 Tax=Enterococcus florum TaxID=2480627 RepID=A0A4V0WPR3_9ENTE|nr:diacylglycerol kinase family protein [Enterococcus florum]GCF94759.1 diacylglycerol kinase [Enterococcus florum]
MKKALLIINPNSGEEEAKNYEELAHEKLNNLFDEVEVLHTQEDGDATRFARQAADEKVDSLFVMGGDGTVNEAVNGLAEQEYRPKFGFFPLGTVNDLAHSLNISMDPATAIEELTLERHQALDIGKINDSYFMNIVSVGSIPEAISEVDGEEKSKFGKLAYFTTAFKQVLHNESYHFSLEVDGEHLDIESSAVVFNLNESIGGFEQVVPNAKPDDGKLHLLYLKDHRITDTFKSVPDILKGIDHSTEYVGYQPFSEATLSVKDDVTLHPSVDGDEGPELPLHLKVLPQHLEVYYGPEE